MSFGSFEEALKILNRIKTYHVEAAVHEAEGRRIDSANRHEHSALAIEYCIDAIKDAWVAEERSFSEAMEKEGQTVSVDDVEPKTVN